MRIQAITLVALACSLGLASKASAQAVVSYSPVVTYATPAVSYYSGPLATNYGYGVAYSPPSGYYVSTNRRAAYYAPAASYYGPTTAYYAPAPVVAPTVVNYAPAPMVAAPAPVLAAPTVAYYPGTVVAPAPVVYTRPGLFRPRVYYGY